MQIERRPDHRAAVLIPDEDDEPAELEDLIHDEVVAGRERDPQRPTVVQVVLDLSRLEVPQQGAWLKAAGAEVPDANLRVALGPVGYAVARSLGIPAYYHWYPDVDAALVAGR